MPNKTYFGQSVKTILGRKLKHRDQCSANRKRNVDQAHGEMNKIGFPRWLFLPVADLDGKADTTRDMRFFEFKGFLVFEPTMNQVDQQGDYTALKVLA